MEGSRHGGGVVLETQTKTKQNATVLIPLEGGFEVLLRRV